MSLIDFILNVAMLLLWLNWRAVPWSALPPPGKSLAATLKPAEPSRPGWLYLVSIAVLVPARSMVYWQLGPSLHWNPILPLGPVTLAFRSDLLGRMALFSFLSFAGTIGLFYLALVFLSALGPETSEAGPQQRLIRLHLGWVDRWPAVLKLMLPFVVMILFWAALNPLLAKMGMTARTLPWRSAAQGVLIGLSIYFILKFLIFGILALHLLNSYVYLGDHSIWKYVNGAASQILRPLKWLPLRFGKLDLSPMAAIVLLILITEIGQRVLVHFYPKLT